MIAADRQFFGQRFFRIEGEDTLAVIDQRLRLGTALDRGIDDIAEPPGDQPRGGGDGVWAVGKPADRRCGDGSFEFDGESRNRFYSRFEAY